MSSIYLFDPRPDYPPQWDEPEEECDNECDECDCDPDDYDLTDPALCWGGRDYP